MSKSLPSSAALDILPATPSKPLEALRAYYALTKPGIIYGNLLTAAAGFLLEAVPGHLYLGLFIALLLGTSLVIASACVFNNYLDRGIDKRMARTKRRALVSGRISPRAALIYASVLGLAGGAVLSRWTNWPTLLVGAIGFIDYVVLYGWSKRHSPHGTLVGTISGSTPIVAGYTAATGRLDLGALLLLVLMATWQMAHFYAIALYRRNEYKAAGIPVWPLQKGVDSTKRLIMAYIVLFIAAALLLSGFGYTGYIYAVLMTLLGLAWLWRGHRGYAGADSKQWGRDMFLFSLLVVMGLSLLTALGGWLP